MKKLMKYIIYTFIIFFSLSLNVDAKEVNVYMFYGEGCPHCEAAYKYLNSIKKSHELNIYRYEVLNNSENRKKFKEIADYLEYSASSVPFTVINNTAIIGYTDNVTSDSYLYHINEASKDDFKDNVGIKLGLIDEEETELQTNDNKSFKFRIPIIKKDVNLRDISLPLVAILLGVIDGFNPCAMWILLFLISTLLGLKDKKRLWVLGVTFLVTSALVYLAFMVSWLNFAKMIGGITIVRTIIAIVALIGGSVNVYSYINSLGKDDGCNVVDAKKRKKIFGKIKKFTHEKSFVIAILGIMLLAASVNIIELACSAGLPVIFTQLLAMNDLSSISYSLYIIIYIICFMFDDLVIFSIAVKSMELTGVSNKYSKYSHLIGGLLMLLIGVLLLVKPEWLMFNF